MDKPREPEPADPGEAKTFTSWKLDLFDALLSDPRISDGHLRVALRVLQAVNRDTRVAYIGDDTLSDDVPRCDRFKANDARKALAALGWWTVERGSGAKASRYTFLTRNINFVLDKRIADRDRRQDDRKRRRQADRRIKGRGGITT